MEFLETSPVKEKYHECLYCRQKYPSERDLSIHEYIHGSYMREAIFNLTIQPRNNYLIYEDFILGCGRMKSGIMFKELGSAETPEQERIESPNKKEFDKSPSNNLPCHHLTQPEYNDKILNKKFDKSSSNNLLMNSHNLTPPQFDKNSRNKKESDTSSDVLSRYNLTPPHPPQEQASYRTESETDLFAYKTFEDVYSMESAEDIEILKALTEKLLVKYETFPTRNGIIPRNNWAHRYKTSLISEADGRGDLPITNSPGIRF